MKDGIKTIEEFAMEVKGLLETYSCMDAFTLEIVKVTKNNDTEMIGILFNPKEDSNSKAAPTAYLNNFYKEYVNGMKTRDVASLLMTSVMVDKRKFDVAFLEKWYESMDKVYPVIINGKLNEEMLKEVPHFFIQDLAVYCRVKICMGDGSEGSVKVTHKMLEKWDINEDRLFHRAKENLQELGMEKFMTMMETIFPGEEVGNPGETYLTDGTDLMYVLTNDSEFYGAGVAMDFDFMNAIAKKIGDGFYMIPSSVHEWLIFPNDADKFDDEGIREIIKSVNDEQVTREDRLSYNLYRYFIDRGIVIA